MTMIFDRWSNGECITFVNWMLASGRILVTTIGFTTTSYRDWITWHYMYVLVLEPFPNLPKISSSISKNAHSFLCLKDKDFSIVFFKVLYFITIPSSSFSCIWFLLSDFVCSLIYPLCPLIYFYIYYYKKHTYRHKT